VNLEADIIAKYVERMLSVAPQVRDGQAAFPILEKLAGADDR
jgi:hypothetical protein